MRHVSIVSLVCAAALLFASCDQKTVDVSGGSDPLGWTQLTQFDQQQEARAVWGNGPNDVYAGYGGPAYLQHFDGTQWKNISLAGDVRSVNDIWSSGPDDVFVATYDDVWHFDGNEWSRGGIRASRVGGYDAGHVLATDARTLARFDGAEWDTLLVVPEYYRVINASWIGAGDSVVVALHYYTDRDSLIRYDGTTWSPPEPGPGRIFDLLGANSDDLIAVGGDFNYTGRVWRWNGAQWADLSAPAGHYVLYAAFGESTNDFYVAGCDILHYTGAGWETLPAAPDDDCFHDVWASGDTDIYAAGRTVQRFDGSAWSPVAEVTPDRADAIWAESRSRVVVAGRSSIFRFENGAWTEEGRELLYGVQAIAGTSWNDLYAATFSGVFHNDGSGWVVMPDSPDEMMRLFILPTGELFAADYHRVFRHNAQGWTLIRNTEDDSDPDIMGSLWAFGANDVLTGSEDNLRRFDGVSWKRIDNVGSFDLLAFSPDNIYSLGPDQLRHSSGGGAFEPVGPFFNATRVTGTSPDHIVVTGRDAYAAYYQGQWVVGTEPKVFNVDLVPAVDGSIVRLDVFAPSRFGIWYHRE